MNYLQIYNKLLEAGLKPVKVVRLESGEVVGLEIYSSSLNADIVIKLIRDEVGDEKIRCSFLPNEEFIKVEL